VRFINRHRIRWALRRRGRVPVEARQALKRMEASVKELFAEMPSSWARKPWQPPVPAGAHFALWEDLHTFVPGGKPKRDPYFGLHNGEPPLSMRCPMCEAEQEPFRGGPDRRCIYCGVTFRLFGTRIFWWREPTTVTVATGASIEWLPPSQPPFPPSPVQ